MCGHPVKIFAATVVLPALSNSVSKKCLVGLPLWDRESRKHGKLLCWRGGRFAVSLPFSLSDLQEGDELRLADLDGDGKKEIIVPDDRGSAVVQFRDGKLRVWKGKADKIWGVLLYAAKGTKFYESDIMTRGGKDFTILWVLPKGKRVLSPSNWRRQEVPIRFEFVGDIDGDGSDEVLGYDSRWNCYRLYRVHPVKSGLLHWESVYLGKDIAFPLVFATIKDGSRRGLVMAVETKGKFKRLELLTVEGTR
jgi:hypothetical protein